jgi:hypothetical protein
VRAIVLVLDEDLGYGKLGDGLQAASALLFLAVLELAAPVDCVEESDDDLASYLLVNSLQTSAAAEKFGEAERFAVVDDFVVREDHEERVEADPSVAFRGHKDFFVKLVESGAPASYFVDGKGAQALVEFADIDFSRFRLRVCE